MLTWEETIIGARHNEELSDLIDQCYLGEDLQDNVKRYGESEEFEEILNLIPPPDVAPNLIDMGAGNGITSANFALKGYKVTAVEPDQSDTVGAEAIRKLKKSLELNSLEVIVGLGEETQLDNDTFDIFFARQALHHAADLEQFVAEAYRLLKPGGIILTVRDHVVFNNNEDRDIFLRTHPLHKYYGGENAFTKEQYLEAFEKAGFLGIRVFDHFSTPINYFPIRREEMEDLPNIREKELRRDLYRKIGHLSRVGLLFELFKTYRGFSHAKVLDERYIPGRMYSFLAEKSG